MAASPPPDGAGGWLASLPVQAREEPLATAQLAWLGDAVWELHQRLRHCRRPGRVADLHRAVVAAVTADAQAEALRCLTPLLSESERGLVLRGRNQAGRGPRRGNATAYGQATGFETMLGWLFLQDPRRLAELLDHLEKTEPCPPAARP